MYKDLEYYNKDLEVRRGVISSVKSAFDSDNTPSVLMEYANSVAELGLKHISKYYPELISSMISSLSRALLGELSPSDYSLISRIRTIATTEPYIESRFDVSNYDLGANPTIGRRTFEDIGRETFSDRFKKFKK